MKHAFSAVIGACLACALSAVLSAVALAEVEAFAEVKAFAKADGQAGKPANYKGLEITPVSIERAMNVALIDCPPGTNTVRGNAKPGEEFAVITLAFKVTPAFKEAVVKKPVLTDSAGKPYNTSVAIIDPGSVPDYKCSFPFRVPAGTKVASLQIDTATIDISSLDVKQP